MLFFIHITRNKTMYFFFMFRKIRVLNFCFFFQAEDGIRYWSVTGVQTCALPICPRERRLPSSTRRRGSARGRRSRPRARFRARRPEPGCPRRRDRPRRCVRPARALGGQIQPVSLCQSLDVSTIEELHVHLGIPLTKLPQLAVLSCDERLLHHGQLDVEVLFGEVEVRCERLDDPAVGALLEHEGVWLVHPRNLVVVEELRAFELDLVGEARLPLSTICLEIGNFFDHPPLRVATASDTTPRGLLTLRACRDATGRGRSPTSRTSTAVAPTSCRASWSARWPRSTSSSRT